MKKQTVPLSATWLNFPYGFAVIPCVLCLSAGFSGCTRLIHGNAVINGEDVFLCVDTSKEDRCHKIDGHPPEIKSTVAPE